MDFHQPLFWLSILAQVGIQTKEKSLCISLLRKGGDKKPVSLKSRTFPPSQGGIEGELSKDREYLPVVVENTLHKNKVGQEILRPHKTDSGRDGHK